MTPPITVREIPALGHEEAMRLAAVEYDRLLALADDLRAEDWARPTDCPGWDVRAVLGHLLGMLELHADPEERARQVKTAAETAAGTGGLRLDAMTALQVREHAHLTADQLKRALRQAAPRALAARRATTAGQRTAAYSPGLPGESQWTFGYLSDVIHTPGSVDAPHRHLPRHRARCRPVRRARRTDPRRRGRGLGTPARPAVHAHADRTGRRLVPRR